MTYAKPIRTLAAAALWLAASLPAYAQSSIQSEPLNTPAPGATKTTPLRATSPVPVYQPPAQPSAQQGYTTPDSAPAFAVPPAGVPANRTSDEQDLINRADVTVRFMRGNQDFKEMDKFLAKAKGVYIVPQLIKAAFFFGGEGGDGVMLARLPDNTWSAPSFSVIGSASFGLQAGAKSSEIVFLVMTDKGMNAILSRDVKLGADASVALITVGKGLGASTAIDTDADIYAVAKSDGLYGGLSLDGSIINPLDGDIQSYYGQKIEARDILNGRVPPPPGAQALIEDLR